MSFHIPEKYRLVTGRLESNSAMGNNGAFEIERPNGRVLWVIASDGLGWEHVSIHVELEDGSLKTPLWDEMCFIKDMFWDEEDVVIQFHPKKSEYVNLHPNTLHLWRPWQYDIPRPPSISIG